MGFNNKHFVNSDKKEVVSDSYAGILARPRESSIIWYATDQGTYYGDNGIELVALGGGGLGDTSTYALLDCETSDNRIDKWDVTNLTNATLTENEGTHLNGKRSYSFNNAVGAEGEFAYFEVALPRKVTLNGASLRGADLSFEYTGTVNSLEVVLFNGSGDVIGTTTIEKLEGDLLVLGSDETQIVRFGIRVITGEVASLTFDDVRISNDPVTMVDIKNDSETITYRGISSLNSNRISYSEVIENTGSDLVSTGQVTFTRLTAKKRVAFVVNATTGRGAAVDRWIELHRYDSAGNLLLVSYSSVQGNEYCQSVSMSGIANIGDYFLVKCVTTPLTGSPDDAYANFSITATPIGASKGYVVADEDRLVSFAAYSCYATTDTVIEIDEDNCLDITTISGGVFQAIIKKECIVEMGIGSNVAGSILVTRDGFGQSVAYNKNGSGYEYGGSVSLLLSAGDSVGMWTGSANYGQWSFSLKLQNKTRTVVAPVAVQYPTETKVLSVAHYANEAIIPELTFTNVEIGKQYTVTFRGYVSNTGGSADNLGVQVVGANNVGANDVPQFWGHVGPGTLSVGGTVKVIATATEISFRTTSFGSGTFLVATSEQTTAQLTRSMETGFIASPKSDIPKHVNDKTPVEKVVGTWDSGNGKQPLYEKSYFVGGGTGAISVDSTLGFSTVTPRNGWGKSPTVFYKGLFTWNSPTGDYVYIQISSTLTLVRSSTYNGTVSFTVQYTKNSENI